MQLEIKAKVRYNTALHYYEISYFILNDKEQGTHLNIFFLPSIITSFVFGRIIPTPIGVMKLEKRQNR